MSDSLKAKLRSGEPTLGTFLSLGSPLAAEACAAAGFDWVLVDLEHGAGDEQILTGQVLAAAAHGVPAIVRVETAERIRSGRVLDAGAAGVMFPRLDSAEEAAEALRHLRYPPAGDRGVATYNRSCGFGLDLGALDTANDAVIGIIQIETLSALDSVEAIAATPDVDVLFVGPRDLSHALGVPGRFDAPTYRTALSRVLAAARDAGVAAGVLAANRAAAEAAVADGFTFVVVGSDANLLAMAARDAAAPIPVPAGS
jgi:2-dehydro-3-deoxyglucarate aldolase/4-hydroxy-2-oxoheptanedioate aldolase